MKIAGVGLLAAALLLGLAGCSSSVPTRVSAANIAHTSAVKLQKEAGLSSPPRIDCGSKDIGLKVGETVHCDVTDPSDGRVYDSVVTITKVNGATYSIAVKVAAAPKN